MLVGTGSYPNGGSKDISFKVFPTFDLSVIGATLATHVHHRAGILNGRLRQKHQSTHPGTSYKQKWIYMNIGLAGLKATNHIPSRQFQ